MDRCLAFLLFLCFNATLLGAQAPSTQPKSTVSAPKTIAYIKAGRLFDATSDSVKSNMVIVSISNAGGEEDPSPPLQTVKAVWEKYGRA